jgi:hypothetical protein
MLFALLLAQTAAPLELTCGGGGAANKADIATVYGAENSGNSAWPTMHERHSEAFRDSVEIRIVSEEGRIRLPKAMLPAVEDGGDGWFRLSNLKMSERTLTAVAAVNLMSNPKVRIDRATGAISISGAAGSYDGVCQGVYPDVRRAS